MFVTFEGSEGSGKSTHIRFTASLLRKWGKEVLLLREPGGTKVSEAVREVLLDPKHKGMARETELLLYLAARAQLVREKIIPALKGGKVVISDRFEDSTVAYQGFGEGISLQTIESFSKFVRGSLVPNLTFLLDINPVKGLARGGRRDRVEKKPDAFHQRVRSGFLKLARLERSRIVLLSTDRPIRDVQAEIRTHLKKWFKP